jgi:hypothetical protein
MILARLKLYVAGLQLSSTMLVAFEVNDFVDPLTTDSRWSSKEKPDDERCETESY